MASEYGPLVLNAKLVEEHKTEDDPFASEWFGQNMVGTGPYRMTENEPNSHIALQWFDGYHGGWAGNHFDSIVMRIQTYQDFGYFGPGEGDELIRQARAAVVTEPPRVLARFVQLFAR